MTVLITGATGFAGRFLVEELSRRQEHELYGTARQELSNFPAPFNQLKDIFALDLCHTNLLEEILRKVKPTQIYHLAGFASVGQAFSKIDEVWHCNFNAAKSLLDAVWRVQISPRIILVTSGLVYGDCETAGIVTEETAFHPPHPYSASKCAADVIGYQYYRYPGLNVIRARPFNHIGPFQSPDFAIASFSKQIASIEHGQQEPVLRTGGLQNFRDFHDVRDTVNAYIALMEKGEVGQAYNIASGKLVSMAELLQLLLEYSRVEIAVEEEATRIRSTEARIAKISIEKLMSTTNWQPKYSLSQTLHDTLDYWRRVVSDNSSASLS